VTEPVEHPPIDDIRRALDEVAAAQRRIEVSVHALDDDQLASPSQLPGWSRAHVVAHLANNAMAFVGMLGGVLGGALVEQYPAGQAQRAVDIEARSTLAPAGLVALLDSAHVQFDAVAAALVDEQWFAPTPSFAGERPAWSLVWSRWREAEVHHVDLDAGYTIDDWPDAFVDVALDAERRCLARRLPVPGDMELSGSDREQLWWLMGRGGDVILDVAGNRAVVEDLAPWGDAGWMPGIPNRS
jgi:maleylpyruvate isomerase